jgi:hypothetical protein
MAGPRLLTAAIAGLAVTSVIGLSAAPALASSTSTNAPVTQNATSKATASAPINQTIAGVGTFVGTFTPTSFTSSNGQLSVTGLLSGVFTSVSGITTPITQTVTTTVVGATNPAACNVLSLQLGPLHLNLLGLVIDLNQINLNITAQPGPGNLLGNLLCAVANLLNGGNTGGLGALLNQLLGL